MDSFVNYWWPIYRVAGFPRCQGRAEFGNLCSSNQLVHEWTFASLHLHGQSVVTFRSAAIGPMAASNCGRQSLVFSIEC